MHWLKRTQLLHSLEMYLFSFNPALILFLYSGMFARSLMDEIYSSIDHQQMIHMQISWKLVNYTFIFTCDFICDVGITKNEIKSSYQILLQAKCYAYKYKLKRNEHWLS